MANRIKGFYTDQNGRKRPINRPKIVHVTYTVPSTSDIRHKKEWVTKGHYIVRNGKKIWIPMHTDKEHVKHYKVHKHNVKRDELRYSGHFNEVAEKIAREYQKKGYSKKDAEYIGRSTAAGIYRHKIAKNYH